MAACHASPTRTSARPFDVRCDQTPFLTWTWTWTWTGPRRASYGCCRLREALRHGDKCSQRWPATPAAEQAGVECSNRVDLVSAARKHGLQVSRLGARKEDRQRSATTAPARRAPCACLLDAVAVDRAPQHRGKKQAREPPSSPVPVAAAADGDAYCREEKTTSR